MRKFVEIADAIGQTTKRVEKLRLISKYFKSLSASDAALAARFLSAHAFAGHDERTLRVGGAILSRVIARAAGQTGATVATTYCKHGAVGDLSEGLLCGAEYRCVLSLWAC